MLVGYPPFYADTKADTCRKIVRWWESLHFPPEAHVSERSQRLIGELLTGRDERLGSKVSPPIDLPWPLIPSHALPCPPMPSHDL